MKNKSQIKKTNKTNNELSVKVQCPSHSTPSISKSLKTKMNTIGLLCCSSITSTGHNRNVVEEITIQR